MASFGWVVIVLIVVALAALTGGQRADVDPWIDTLLGDPELAPIAAAASAALGDPASPDRVVFPAGGVRGADESLPYPRRHLAAYPLTKATAEAEVLDADGPGLATVALRPHLIWGPGDPHLLPSLLRAVRGGRLVLPGDGGNLVDTTHVRTAAHAHLLALDRLKKVFGQIFIISHVVDVQESALLDELWSVEEDDEGRSSVRRIDVSSGSPEVLLDRAVGRP